MWKYYWLCSFWLCDLFDRQWRWWIKRRKFDFKPKSWKLLSHTYSSQVPIFICFIGMIKTVCLPYITVDFSFQVLFTIGQSSVLYITFFVVILIGYIFLSLSNADTNLAKELKIEVAYESKVHEQKSAELQRELRKLRHYFSTASAAASMENSSLDVMTLGSSNPN